MNILIVTGVYKIGGPATYTRLLLDNISQHNNKAEVLTFDRVRLLPKFIRHFVFLYYLLKKIRHFDLVFAQDPVSVGWPSLVAVKLFHKKLVIRFVGDYAWEQGVQRFGVLDSIDDFQKKRYGFKVEFFRRIQVFVLNHANKVITPSIYFGTLAKNLVDNPDKVQVIYNGIDTKDQTIGKNNARQKLNLNDNLIILFSAGRLVNWKGFDALIEILPRFIKENSNFRLYIAGDGPEKNNLAKKIIDLKLEKYAYLLGSLDSGSLKKYLQASDIFILNTGFESFSFQVLEAMYYGVPVITSDRCNLPEIIEDQKNGLLVNYNNKVEIENAIRHLLVDTNFRKKIIDNAKIRSADFSVDNTIAKTIALFDKL
jgi:glycosyltransferase involved in cell wall biosynthesis